MFKTIRWRLISYYLVVIAVIVILMGVFFIWFLNYFYMQSLRESLYNQARLTVTLVEEMLDRSAPPEEIDALYKSLGSELGVRVTLIDAAGTVLADSAENPARMENHRDRPEVVEALRFSKGIAVRYSVTLDEEMYYLAVPVRTGPDQSLDQQSKAVVRLALPLARINQAIASLKMFIAGALVLASLAALTAAILLSNRITGPIKRISNASQAIAEGNFDPSLEVAGQDELAALAENIKLMGRTLNKKIEQVVWEKNKLETIVSSMSSGVILTDGEMKIELVNPAAAKLFELSRDKDVGMPLQTAVRYYNLYENLRAVYEENKQKMIELNIYHPRRAVLETYLLPVSGADGSVIGALLLFHEVTHLRSIEKMRSDFVANVSHELRTPLTTIRGYTETIMDEDLSPGELANFLQVIDKETKRLSGLLDDLLDLAQIENEKGFVKKEPVNMAAMIGEALWRVEDQARQKEVKIEAGFPEAAIYVSGNYEWLCQAVINIIENSIRHGNPGGVVNITLAAAGGAAIVKIVDNGPGIPAADLPYVFERFYRADKARSRKSGGTGLGLSIVKHIMEAHDASYELVSGEGKGTVFRFSLPVIEPVVTS